METGHEQGTSTRDLAGGAVEDRVPDDGRDRETPVGTDDIGGVDAGVERPERPASGRDDDTTSPCCRTTRAPATSTAGRSCRPASSTSPAGPSSRPTSSSRR